MRARRSLGVKLVSVGLGKAVPFGAADLLSRSLGIEPAQLLQTISISPRTARRRKKQGFLKPEEADRLLRVRRVLKEAVRVFGSEEKAGRWMRTAHPVLGDEAPLARLDSDAGAQLVSNELVRIDYGDFA